MVALDRAKNSARPAGLEPATGSLEGQIVTRKDAELLHNSEHDTLTMTQDYSEFLW
jgi:hypothetical protein